jgi:hypothetical protein
VEHQLFMRVAALHLVLTEEVQAVQVVVEHRVLRLVLLVAQTQAAGVEVATDILLVWLAAATGDPAL